MKTRYFHPSIFLAAALCGPVAADTIYSNYQNITIPTDFTGVTVSVAGGTLNPFFGGVGVANNDLLQPIRTSTSNLGTLRDFTVGTTIDASQLYLSTGFGGSSTHLGATFTAGSEGYIGFKLNDANYGWMRVVFTSNTGGAVIKDWAYDNRGAAIVTGRVEQSAAVTSAQIVTLSPTSGESFTLGSQITNTGGNTNSVVKAGAGATALTGANTYSGTTTINGGVLTIDSAATINSTSGITIAGGALNYNSATALSQGVSFSGTGGTLSGTGTISQAVIVTSGNIQTAGTSVIAGQPAATLGKQTFTTGITYQQGSIFEWNLTANTDTGIGTREINYDAINTGSLVTTGPGAIFRVVLNGSQNFTENFWNANHTWSDTFTNLTGTNLDIATIFGGGVQYWNSATGNLSTPTSQGSFTITGTSLTWSAVPEPTGALAGILLESVLLRRSRSRFSY